MPDVGDNNDWAPHGSKTVRGFVVQAFFLGNSADKFEIQMFMLDLLDNLPRLRLSDDHLKAIIWIMRECGTPNVPAFSALRRMQEKLTRDVGIKTDSHTSSLGNRFFMNHPVDLLKLVSTSFTHIVTKIYTVGNLQDWANPLVRKFIRVYPEAAQCISESWQSGKWLNEVDYDSLSPMWADWEHTEHRHFYIKELAQLVYGSFVMPMRWIVLNDAVHVEVYDVTRFAAVSVILYSSEVASLKHLESPVWHVCDQR